MQKNAAAHPRRNNEELGPGIWLKIQIHQDYMLVRKKPVYY
jgi:hypothetical protein